MIFQGCGQMFDTLHALQWHETNEKSSSRDHQQSFPCVQCCHVLESEASLLHHMRAHDLTDDVIHRCTQCMVGFDDIEAMVQHKQSHFSDAVIQ